MRRVAVQTAENDSGRENQDYSLREYFFHSETVVPGAGDVTSFDSLLKGLKLLGKSIKVSVFIV
jgi:hypothetical protein